MSVEKTEVKVTKIKQAPSQYYTPRKVQTCTEPEQKKENSYEIEEPVISEWIKESTVNKEETKHGFSLGKTEMLSAETRELLQKIFHMTKEKASILRRKLGKIFVEVAADRAKRLVASGTACILLVGGCMTAVLATCSVAFHVKLGDKEIGDLPSEKAYYEILSDVKEEVYNTADIEFEPSGELSVNRVLIGKGEYTKVDVVKEKLKSTSDEMVPAWAVSVDKSTVVALPTQKEALSVLDSLKQQYAEENATVTFSSKVEVEKKFVPLQILKTEEDAFACLTGENAPEIKIRSVVECEGEEEIPFETEQQPDASRYEGDVSVLQEGVAGAKYAKYYLEKINGEVVEKKIIKEEILRQPVKQIELAGTKERPSPVGTGEFAQPVSGTLTSSYGARWGRSHKGIDIGASTGTPVYASDNGTVVYSQYNDGGYGYLVQIDHGNGYVTYYGHCSELLVNAGDVVAKGDLIAKVGSTGRSTGPHLHFEVRKDGEAQNPTNYLN